MAYNSSTATPRRPVSYEPSRQRTVWATATQKFLAIKKEFCVLSLHTHTVLFAWRFCPYSFIESVTALETSLALGFVALLGRRVQPAKEVSERMYGHHSAPRQQPDEGPVDGWLHGPQSVGGEGLAEIVKLYSQETRTSMKLYGQNLQAKRSSDNP